MATVALLSPNQIIVKNPEDIDAIIKSSRDLLEVSRDATLEQAIENKALSLLSKMVALKGNVSTILNELILVTTVSINALEGLRSGLISRVVGVERLASLAAKGFAALAVLAPRNLAGFEEPIATALETNLIKIGDLRFASYRPKFGQKEGLLVTKRGQIVYAREHYERNYPLLFIERTLGQFKGDKLIFGGGTKCTHKVEKHPPAQWYSCDIQLTVRPDLIIDAGYPPHLDYFPGRRFSVIFFEHLPFGSDPQDPEITGSISHFKRMLKGDGLIVLDTSYGTEAEIENRVKNLKMVFCNEGLRAINPDFYKDEYGHFARLVFTQDQGSDSREIAIRAAVLCPPP